ncbi:MAG: porin family protein [Pseudomonadota bacterium]
MNKALSLAVATAALAAGPAFAEGSFYADGGYTFTAIDLEDSGTSLDVDLGSITARGGYDFTENFGVELEGSFGVADEDVLGATVELSYLIGAYGKVQAPLSETLNVFARAGVVSAELEVSGGGISESASETGFGIGVGATIDFAENLYVRGDYTRLDIEDLEADAFTISLGVRF